MPLTNQTRFSVDIHPTQGVSPLSLVFPLNYQGVVLDYPKGGTEALVDALVRGVERNGGEVRVGAHVEEILVEGGKARGVGLRGGKVVRTTR